MRVLDLFSGIGAFSLGLERAGMRTVAFCECEPYCRRVLHKHWPTVPCYDDVRTLDAARLAADGIGIDVICGGFPCQDISVAGKGAGINGERSGLWSEFARLIGEIRPRYALIENVAALLGRGMGDVLCDLAALGYDAEWHVISAADMGAPHRRERVWIVAYPGYAERQHDLGLPQIMAAGSAEAQPEPTSCGGDVPHDAQREWSGGPAAFARGGGAERGPQGAAGGLRDDVADAIGAGLEGRAGLAGDAAGQFAAAERSGAGAPGDGWPEGQPQLDAWSGATRGERSGQFGRVCADAAECDWWLVEPDVGRVAHGVAHRVDRLRALGNSLVPQIPEMLGSAIMAQK